MMQLEFGGTRYSIAAGETVIGTAPGCAVVLAGDGVQPRHAVLYGSPAGAAIRAATAEAVVLVNGVLLGSDPTPLRHGDRIQIGGHELLAVDPDRGERSQLVGVQAGAGRAGVEPAAGVPAAVSAVPLPTAPAGAAYRLSDTMYGQAATPPAAVNAGPPLASLLVRSGAQKGRRLAVKAAVVRIGRADYNDVVIADPSVSAEHARLERRDGLWLLSDAGSTNGTYADGEPVIEGEDVPLLPGANLRFGEVTALFEPHDDVTEPAPAGDTRVVERVEGPPAFVPPVPISVAPPPPPLVVGERDRPAPTPVQEEARRSDADDGSAAADVVMPTPARRPARPSPVAPAKSGVPGWLLAVVVAAAAAAGVALWLVLLK